MALLIRLSRLISKGLSSDNNGKAIKINIKTVNFIIYESYDISTDLRWSGAFAVARFGFRCISNIDNYL